jgi:hypothetical protein
MRLDGGSEVSGVLDGFEAENNKAIEAANVAANRRPEAKSALATLMRRLGG